MTAVAPARVLAVTAVAAEADAVCAGLDPHRWVPEQLGSLRVRRGHGAAGTVDVLAGGVGPAAAAAATAAAVATARAAGHGYDWVVNLGVAGGFAQRGVAVGDAVVAERVVWADLGADSPGGPIPAADLGWAEAAPPVDPDLVAAARLRLGALGIRAHAGPVVTVATVTGTAARADWLSARFGAYAEAMEGVGVLHAAATLGVPAVEIRTISNPVGPRDRSTWDLPVALSALTVVAAAVLAVPLDGRRAATAAPPAPGPRSPGPPQQPRPPA